MDDQTNGNEIEEQPSDVEETKGNSNTLTLTTGGGALTFGAKVTR